MTLGKVILCRGPNSDPRQNRRQVKAVCLPSQVYRRPCFAESRTSAKINFCQWPFFADGRTLGKGPGCREEFFADGLALGKYGFADGLPLPRADSRQTFLCREPDIWLSAKTLALGNGPVSGSAYNDSRTEPAAVAESCTQQVTRTKIQMTVKQLNFGANPT